LTHEDFVERCRRFIVQSHPRKITGENIEEREDFTYLDQARHISLTTPNGLLDIDADDLGNLDDSLEDALFQRPAALRDAMVEALDKELKPTFKEGGHPVYPNFVFVTGAESEVDELRSCNVSRLVTVKAQVMAIERVIPYYKNKVFRCIEAGHVFTVPVGLWDQGIRPRICGINKKCKGGFQHLEDDAEMFDVQWLKLKELIEPERDNDEEEQTEEADWSSEPMNVVLTHALCGVRFNSMVVIHAIPRIRPPLRNANKPTNLFYLEAIGIEIIEDKGLEISASEVEQFKKLTAQGEEGIQKIIHSIAPYIEGRGMIKRFMALQQVLISLPRRLGQPWTRHRLHGLVVGDPGTGKSALLRWQAECAHIGVYTSGEGASGVGLAAAVIRDEETGRRYLESGALTRANGGLASVDEISAIKDNDFQKVKNGMEHEEITIDKWGLGKTIACHTSLFAATNPEGERFKPEQAPNNFISLPASMESRFDVIFALVDKPGTESDLLFGAAMVDKFCGEIKGGPDSFLDIEFLRKFFYWTAQNIHPEFPRKIRQLIIDHFVKERRISMQDRVYDNRDLEALMRLAMGEATLRHAQEVEEQDVERAKDMYYASTATRYSLVYDPQIIDTYTPWEMDGVHKEILEVITRLGSRSSDGGVPEMELAEELSLNKGIDHNTVYKNLPKLAKTGKIRHDNGRVYLA